ncbi:Aspercryptin biosynthesis cluster-specific transcription regulator atnN [Paramyrothecium foliicola]|nr:Aspercryptin biosynthesis cluster-specific transcription regulator atnN [Paramyrothecium foliicola]
MHAPFHSSLWIDWIFQLSEKHAFVMSALVALSSMHESYTCPSENQSINQQEAMHHYHNAMKEISCVDSSQTPIDAILVSSILFYTLENLRGSFYNAMLHVQSGVKIISEQRQFQSQSPLLAKSIHRDFLSIQNQVMELGSPDMSRAYDATQGFNPPLPNAFETVDDALYHMEIIYNEMYCVIDYYENIRNSSCHDAFSLGLRDYHERVSQRLAQWNVEFANLELLLNGGVDARQRQSFFLLRIFKLVIKFFFKSMSNAECFQSFDPDIANILELIDSFLQSEYEDSEATKCKFSLSLGVLPPLFLLSYRCNYAPFRDKALELLSSYNRREGLWDSSTLLQLAHKINAQKSILAPTGSNKQAHVSNISLVSDIACQVDLVVIETVPVGGTSELHDISAENHRIIEIIKQF